MKRATLTRNLDEMMKRTLSIFLPVNVLKIFVHGSYFRGDETPGDLDIVMLVNVKEQFSEWSESFHSLSDYHRALWECYEKGMSFSEAANSVLASEIETRKIPKEWLTCVSWTDIFWSFLPYCLNWEKITKQLLTKGMKGVHIEFVTTEMFTHILGRLYTYQEMPAFLFWSSESPDKVMSTPNSDEFQIYLKLENDRLLRDLADAQFRSKIGIVIIEKVLTHVPKEKLGIATVRVLGNTAKYEVTEEQLREELRKFGLPESAVFALKNRGSRTWYSLAETEVEQKELNQRVNVNTEKYSTEVRVLKILKKCIMKNEGSRVDCRVLNLEKGLVKVSIVKPGILTDEDFRKIWEPRDFKVETIFGPVYAEKSIILSLNSTQTKLQDAIMNCLRVKK